MSSSEKVNLEVMSSKDSSSTTSSLIQLKEKNPIQYFECFKKRRVFPKMSEIGGLLTTIILLLIPSVCFLFFSLLLGSEFKSFSMKDFIADIFGFALNFITFISTLFCLWDVSTTSPGFQESPKMSLSQFKEESPTKMLRNVLFTLKYCETCQIVRDIRTFHCRICDMCVEKQDHHCGFVANCIGKKNILKFLSFLISVVVHCIMLGSFSAFNLFSVISTYKALVNQNWLFPFVILTLIALIFLFIVGSMSIQLIIMISRNQTTNEQLRKKYDNSVFDDGLKQNWKETFLNRK